MKQWKVTYKVYDGYDIAYEVKYVRAEDSFEAIRAARLRHKDIVDLEEVKEWVSLIRK